jgi:hypothetical protein
LLRISVLLDPLATAGQVNSQELVIENPFSFAVLAELFAEHFHAHTPFANEIVEQIIPKSYVLAVYICHESVTNFMILIQISG